MSEQKPISPWALAQARDLCLGMGQAGTVWFEQGVKRVAAALESNTDLAWANGRNSGYEDGIQHRLQVLRAELVAEAENTSNKEN